MLGWVLVVLLSLSLSPVALSQTLSNLPQCWQDCVNSSSGQLNCAALDVGCVCRAWGSTLLTTTLKCVTSNCPNSQDTSPLVSQLELICDLAGVPIPSSVVSSAVAAASTLPVTTSYVTAIVTESLTSFATTVVLPETDSSGHTVLVAFPVTIEPSTTINGSPSTSTPVVMSTSGSSAGSYNLGSCDNPGIVYGYGFDGTQGYGFEPANQTQFPHNSSVDIASIESYICNRLKTTCNASTEAQQNCNNAFNAYSGLAGQNAANVWNVAMGLPLSASTTVTSTTTSTAAGSSSGTSSTQTAVIVVTSTSVTSHSSTSSTTATSTPTPATTTTTSTKAAPAAASTIYPGGSPFDPQGAASLPPIPRLTGCLLFIFGILAAAAW